MVRIAGPVPGSHIEFKPTFNGYDKDPEPVRVYVRAPTQAEKRAHFARVVELIRISREGSATVDMKPKDLAESVRLDLEGFVVRVDGYIDAAGVPIATAQDLWERGEEGVCDEVGVFINSLLGLGEAQRKNSAGSSASSQPTTPVSSGIAASASPATSQGSATVSGPTTTQSSATSS